MYTTVELVTAKLGLFSELITKTMEDEDIQAFITAADDTIDGYIVAAVKLPFTSVPKLIASISTDIAVRNLWAQTQARDLPEHVKIDYENAIKLLNSIAKGSLKLSAEDPDAEGFNTFKYSASGRVFSDTL